jgi:hypothetical protein
MDLVQVMAHSTLRLTTKARGLEACVVMDRDESYRETRVASLQKIKRYIHSSKKRKKKLVLWINSSNTRSKIVRLDSFNYRAKSITLEF